jgi:hypothetical protein
MYFSPIIVEIYYKNSWILFIDDVFNVDQNFVDFYPCIKGLSEGTNLKYEAEFRHILMTVSRTELTLWIWKHGTEHEWLWWMSIILEVETGEEITHALNVAALGEKEATAISVAAVRLREKVVKAFWGSKQ